MKIWISADALSDPNDSTLLWPGTLYGLHRLQNVDHEISASPEGLSDYQQKLLEHDQLTFSSFDRSEADVVVTVDNGHLQFHDSEQDQIVTASNWSELSDQLLYPDRTASIQRKTAETDISLSLNIDGSGDSSISTGLDFFDHMLEQIARHGVMDLEIDCAGDLEVDEHHTIEDVAIALGDAFREALGDKKGVQRYSFVLPMDESRATLALDFSGRPYLEFEGTFNREYVGDFPTEMVKHFFHSLATHMHATLHVMVTGENEHHKLEACFKGLALTLRAATTRSERMLNIIPSSKGTL